MILRGAGNVGYYSAWYVMKRLLEFGPGGVTEVAILHVTREDADDALRNFDAVAQGILSDVDREIGLGPGVVKAYRLVVETREGLKFRWMAARIR